MSSIISRTGTITIRFYSYNSANYVHENGGGGGGATLLIRRFQSVRPKKFFRL